MALDPSIPLQIRTPQMGGADYLGRAVQLREAAMRMQMLPLQLQEQQLQNQALQAKVMQQQQDQADDRRIADEYVNVNGDTNKLLENVRGQISSHKYLQLQTSLAQREKAVADAKEAEIKNHQALLAEANKTFSVLGSLGEDVKPEDRERVYQTEKKRLETGGYIPPGYAPEHYDPQWIAVQRAHVLGAEKLFEEELKRREDKNKSAQEALKNKDLLRMDAANQYQNVTNQEEHDAWRNSLDPSIRGEYPKTFDEKKSRPIIENKALTAEQRQKATEAANKEPTANETLLKIRGKGGKTGNSVVDALDPKDAAAIAGGEASTPFALIVTAKKSELGRDLTSKELLGIQQQLKETPPDEVATLTEEAKRKMSEMFATTGQLPALGYGKQAAQLRSEIMNRAAKDFPNVDFATNKAAFQANQSSLKKLQTAQDAIEGFEKTAGKNLDQFLTTAQKVVDSGSPWINKPLRTVAADALGSSDQAAFNTARTVATTEIAKVLNNPNSSAAVSDSARKEVEQLISPNASLKQIVSAAKILRTDMANRRDSGREQIAEIQKRIGGNETGNETSNGTAPPLPARLSQSDKGKIFTNRDGKKIKVTDVNPADPTQFKFEAQ